MIAGGILWTAGSARGWDKKVTGMGRFEIPIRDAVETVEFPDSWQVHWAPIAYVPALTPDQMWAALANPIRTG